MPLDERWKRGLRLFNEKEFFECHDVIEELWLETDSADPHRNLYKGVIQAAAALYQYQRGIPSGAFGLYRTSVSYLKKYAPRALGLDVRQLVGDMNACFEHLKGQKDARHAPIPARLVPRLRYRFS